MFTSFALRSTANVHNLVFLDTPFENEDRIDDNQHCIQKCFPFGTVIKLMIDALIICQTVVTETFTKKTQIQL